MEEYRRAEREIAEYLSRRWRKAFELWMGCLVDAGQILEFAPPLEVREDIWRDTCNTFLYDTGFRSGKRVAQWLYRTFGLGKKSLKERTIYTDIFFSQSGMGEIELLKGEERILRFRGGSYIAREMGRVGRKVCYYLAGFIAGATQHFTGRNYRVEELRCYSNRDPHCEFVARPL